MKTVNLGAGPIRPSTVYGIILDPIRILSEIELRFFRINHETHLIIAITPPINTTRPPKTRGTVMKLSA